MTSTQTSPQQWARGMLVPGRAAVLDVESTNLDGSIIEICVLTPRPGIHCSIPWSIRARLRSTRTRMPCMEFPRPI